jgi:hypothetical protein
MAETRSQPEEAVVRVRSKVLAPVFIASSAATIAIAFAPLAAADADTPACVDTGPSTQCQTAGNAQITAAPPLQASQPGSPYFGTEYGPFFGYDRGRM